VTRRAWASKHITSLPTSPESVVAFKSISPDLPMSRHLGQDIQYLSDLAPDSDEATIFKRMASNLFCRQFTVLARAFARWNIWTLIWLRPMASPGNSRSLPAMSFELSHAARNVLEPQRAPSAEHVVSVLPELSRTTSSASLGAFAWEPQLTPNAECQVPIMPELPGSAYSLSLGAFALEPQLAPSAERQVPMLPSLSSGTASMDSRMTPSRWPPCPKSFGHEP